MAITDKLVSSWPMNELSGTDVFDKWDANNGVASGATINTTDPKVGAACRVFDGLNDYVTITGYKGILGANVRSFSCWFRTTSASTMALMAYGQVGAVNYSQFQITKEGTSNIYLRISGSTNSYTNASALNDGNWHHLVLVTYTGGVMGDIDVYVDNVLLSTAANTVVINTISENDFTIGSKWDGTLPWSGDIDSVHWFDDSLDSGDVSLLYNSGNGIEYTIGGKFFCSTSRFDKGDPMNEFSSKNVII